MIKVKKIIALYITVLLLNLAFTACGADEVEYSGTFAIEQIQDDPHTFLGAISLIGIVGDVNSQDFTLQNGTGTFIITVDYRGSQAFPQSGDEIVVQGQLSENRPCCGPGFTLRTTQFELVE